MIVSSATATAVETEVYWALSEKVYDTPAVSAPAGIASWYVALPTDTLLSHGVLEISSRTDSSKEDVDHFANAVSSVGMITPLSMSLLVAVNLVRTVVIVTDGMSPLDPPAALASLAASYSYHYYYHLYNW